MLWPRLPWFAKFLRGLASRLQGSRKSATEIFLTSPSDIELVFIGDSALVEPSPSPPVSPSVDWGHKGVVLEADSRPIECILESVPFLLGHRVTMLDLPTTVGSGLSAGPVRVTLRWIAELPTEVEWAEVAATWQLKLAPARLLALLLEYYAHVLPDGYVWAFGDEAEILGQRRHVLVHKRQDRLNLMWWNKPHLLRCPFYIVCYEELLE